MVRVKPEAAAGAGIIEESGDIEKSKQGKKVKKSCK
jgi:hypothetical protein